MPMIVQYTPDQVEDAPIAKVRMDGNDPVATALGKLGTQIQSTAQDVADVYRKEQEAADLDVKQRAAIAFDSMANDAKVKIASAEGAEAYGDKDTPVTAGRAALDDIDNKAADWISKNTTTDKQAHAAMLAFEAERNAVEAAGLTHALKTKRLDEEKSYTSFQALALNKIAQYATDPEHQKDYEEWITKRGDAIEEYANAHDWSQEQLDLEYAKHEQEVTKLKATQMMQINGVAAKQYIEENKEALGSEYTVLKHSVELVASEQQGINAAEKYTPDLMHESYTTVRQKLFKEFGGGTPEFDAKSFKIAEAQLSSNHADLEKQRIANVEQYETPIYKAIIDIEKTGRKASPKDLAAMPAYQKMILDPDPKVILAAKKISDEVYNEHKTEETIRKQEEATRRTIAIQERAYRHQLAQEKKAAMKEAQTSAYMQYENNPHLLAGMSEASKLTVARALGPLGDNFLKLAAKTTSPEALDKIAMDNATLRKKLGLLGISKGKMDEVQMGALTYLRARQHDEGRAYTETEIDHALGTAFMDVDAGYRTKDYIGDGYTYGVRTQKRYEVKKATNIKIPDRILTTKILPKMKSFGVKDTPENRARAYDAFLDEVAAAKRGQL